MRALLLAFALVLAGCADPAAPQDDETDEGGPEVEVDDTTGGIRGVVVDQAIVPIAEAKVALTSTDPPRETVTDAQGRFAFSKVPPGVQFLEVSKVVHETVQTSVNVEAGVTEPPMLRIQMTRLYDENPFMTEQYFQGHFGCAYNFFVSSTCVNDYTRLNPTGHCPGGCFPELARLLDSREYVTQLEADWQTIQAELVWEPSLVGTADTMGMTISYFARPTATHYWFSGSGESPLLARLDFGTSHPSENTPSGSLQEIPQEGLEDLFVFMSAGSEQVAIEQEFEIFHLTSYYAPLPEGWSFVAGDENPF